MGRSKGRWAANPDAKFTAAEPDGNSAAPIDVIKQQFAQRLWTLMTDKGWNQSELGRASELNRDVISVYINAKSLPEPKNAAKLAKALGVKVADLYPGSVERGIEQELPSFDFKQAMGGKPGMGWLRVNMEISATKALRIMQIIHEE